MYIMWKCLPRAQTYHAYGSVYQNVCITMIVALRELSRKINKSSNVLKVINPLCNHGLLDAEDHLST